LSDTKNFQFLFTSSFLAHTANHQVLKLSFVRLNWSKTMDKVAISWQNKVGLPTPVCF